MNDEGHAPKAMRPCPPAPPAMPRKNSRRQLRQRQHRPSRKAAKRRPTLHHDRPLCAIEMPLTLPAASAKPALHSHPFAGAAPNQSLSRYRRGGVL
eukprot:1735892-Prymnesium_polylepis.1